MGKTINYKITMLSDWHVGSGLDAGAVADNVVLKDENNLPFIPGKTIKGLLKDSANEISTVGHADEKLIGDIFGGIKEDNSTFSGNAYFENAYLKEEEAKDIVANELTGYLYRTFASTKIEENGVAKKNSLRTIEVTLPVTLYGKIILNEKLNDKAVELLNNAMKWTRYLGVNRNRGLGRCKFEIIEK